MSTDGPEIVMFCAPSGAASSSRSRNTRDMCIAIPRANRQLSGAQRAPALSPKFCRRRNALTLGDLVELTSADVLNLVLRPAGPFDDEAIGGGARTQAKRDRQL